MATRRTAAIGMLASGTNAPKSTAIGQANTPKPDHQRPGVPMSFDETYLPREIGAKVAADDLEAEPVFALLEDKYGTPLVEAEYKLEAAAADPVAAEALQVPAGSPIS